MKASRASPRQNKWITYLEQTNKEKKSIEFRERIVRARSDSSLFLKIGRERENDCSNFDELLFFNRFLHRQRKKKFIIR